MATHFCWGAWNNLGTFADAFTQLSTRLSNSFQMCSIGLKSGVHGRPGEDLDVVVAVFFGGGTVWRGVLHRVWRCRVEIQRHATLDV